MVTQKSYSRRKATTRPVASIFIFVFQTCTGNAFQLFHPMSMRSQTLQSLHAPLMAHCAAKNDASTNTDMFTLLVRSATKTLTSSDVSENEIEHSYGSASQGQWICSRTAEDMQREVLDGMVLKQFRILVALFSKNVNLDFYMKRQRGKRELISFENEFALEYNVGERNHSIFTDIHQKSKFDPINITASNNKQSRPHGHAPNNHKHDAFHMLIQRSLHATMQSDITRGEFSGNSDGSSSQGRWMDAPSSEGLRKFLDRLALHPQSNQVLGVEEEQRAQWIRWMKNVPSPLFLDLTSHAHDIIIDNHNTSDDPWISKEHLEFVDMSLDRYVSRVACHVIFLPSGAETAPLSLVESTGAHVYGKLLYGGVNRFRILNSGKTVRRVGEKRETMSGGVISHPSWVQLGGIERKYEALDIGPAAVLELTLLPRLWQDLPTVFDKSVLMGGASTDMVLSSAAFGWDPAVMLDFLSEEELLPVNNTDGCNPDSMSSHTLQSCEGKQKADALSTHFQSRVGGLQPQIDAIIRRVLDGRSIYSNFNADKSNSIIKKARLEAEELAALGLQPVRGLLLYGKPGTGKTLLAREIARVLGARPPKICAAPELLDRWVGGSERRVRELFRDAEEELAMCRMAAGADESGAFLQSALHVVVIDEIDAVFRKRIDADNSDSITRNSVVNQLLAKLDGVHALPNILMIGMTNRRELLDEALLRPGRLEVQVEVPLPAESGRREILQIHFGGLRSKGRLSDPLCCAIDGIRKDSQRIRPLSKRRKINDLAQKALRPLSMIQSRGLVDLASDEYTGGFSGADIAGLVRNAGSIALSRARVDGSGVNGLLITLEDVMQALNESKS
ncbi:hypothetical protein ACHAW6_010965 [Cyclotella cf. meneghiniana]